MRWGNKIQNLKKPVKWGGARGGALYIAYCYSGSGIIFSIDYSFRAMYFLYAPSLCSPGPSGAGAVRGARGGHGLGEGGIECYQK